MPNAIKYSTSAQTLALKKGNFWIGTGDVPKGPTSTTDYWSGITPPAGGYTIYLNKSVNGPSIYVASNDSQLIDFTNRVAGTSYTTANECLTYFAGQSDKMVTNIDYPSIVTDGLILNLDSRYLPSYPTTNTTWFDISPTNTNTSIPSSGTYSNGTMNYVYNSSGIGPLSTANSYDNTMECWFYVPSGGSYGGCCETIFGTYWFRTFLIGQTLYTMIGFWTGSTYLYQHPAFTISYDTWHCAVGVRRNDRYIIWIDGVEVYNSNFGSGMSLYDPVGSWVISDADHPNIKVAIARMYKKGLSDVEISQNYYQGPIVTSNLLVALDASNLVSYGGTGTTWRDLTPNGSNGNLINGPTFSNEAGGSIIFDGSDDYSDISIPSVTSYGTITICAFIKWISFDNDMFFGMTTYDVWTYNNTLGFNNGAGNVIGINATTVSNLGLLGNWKHYTFVMNSSGLLSNNKIYINGVSVGSLSAQVGGDSNAPGFATNLRLCGWNNDGGYRANLQYGNFQVYNRELTVGEINQNFNAQRGRFGI